MIQICRFKSYRLVTELKIQFIYANIYIIIMDNIFLENFQTSKSRNRAYSSMNYREYQDLFGTPPKMPKAPDSKPLEDPIDIPPLMLEQETSTVRQPVQQKQNRRIKYKIETIPEIEGSENNSMIFQSPSKNQQLFLFRSNSRMEDVEDPMESNQMLSRKRNRPRSYSENSPIHSRLRIIDFLSELNNKGRKMIKLQ